MTERTELERVIRSLAIVLARGHGLIPVPHQDLRILVEAAKRDLINNGEALERKP